VYLRYLSYICRRRLHFFFFFLSLPSDDDAGGEARAGQCPLLAHRSQHAATIRRPLEHLQASAALILAVGLAPPHRICCLAIPSVCACLVFVYYVFCLLVFLVCIKHCTVMIHSTCLATSRLHYKPVHLHQRFTAISACHIEHVMITRQLSAGSG
jgi:hypothetical protein